MSRSSWWPISIMAWALTADLAMVFNLPLPVRLVVVIGFLLVGPGMSFVRLLRLHQFATELTLAIALSLALDTIVAEGLVLARLWNAGLALGVLIALTLAGSIWQLLSSRPAGRLALEE